MASLEIWGESYQTPVGYIGLLGEGDYKHQFGGNEWEFFSADNDVKSISLLLELDLKDERLAPINLQGIGKLPLASRINSRAWEVPQSYQIDFASKQLTFDSIGIENHGLLAVNETLSLPLPHQKIKLQAMERGDYPFDEDAYWSVCDEFVGGDRFIRVLGPPLWLQDPESVTCKCNAPMKYVCGIGYQNYEQGAGFVDGAFFIGEAALYFYYCPECSRVNVISQST